MTAHFKDNIMTVVGDSGEALQYAKDGDKWRQVKTGKMVSYEDHITLNKLFSMGIKAKKEGRVKKLQ